MSIYFSRSMYSTSSYSNSAAPRAFLPHSAINLSVKSPADGSSSAPPLPPHADTLDLSLSAGGAGHSFPSPVPVSSTAAAASAASSLSTTASQPTPPQILDLTRPLAPIR